MEPTAEQQKRNQDGEKMFIEHGPTLIQDIHARVYYTIFSTTNNRRYNVLMGTVNNAAESYLNKRILSQHQYLIYPSNIRNIGCSHNAARPIACTCPDFLYRGPAVVDEFMGPDGRIVPRDKQTFIKKCKHMVYVEQALAVA